MFSSRTDGIRGRCLRPQQYALQQSCCDDGTTVLVVSARTCVQRECILTGRVTGRRSLLFIVTTHGPKSFIDSPVYVCIRPCSAVLRTPWNCTMQYEARMFDCYEGESVRGAYREEERSTYLDCTTHRSPRGHLHRVSGQAGRHLQLPGST